MRAFIISPQLAEDAQLLVSIAAFSEQGATGCVLALGDLYHSSFAKKDDAPASVKLEARPR